MMISWTRSALNARNSRNTRSRDRRSNENQSEIRMRMNVRLACRLTPIRRWTSSSFLFRIRSIIWANPCPTLHERVTEIEGKNFLKIYKYRIACYTWRIPQKSHNPRENSRRDARISRLISGDTDPRSRDFISTLAA